MNGTIFGIGEKRQHTMDGTIFVLRLLWKIRVWQHDTGWRKSGKNNEWHHFCTMDGTIFVVQSSVLGTPEIQKVSLPSKTARALVGPCRSTGTRLVRLLVTRYSSCDWTIRVG